MALRNDFYTEEHVNVWSGPAVFAGWQEFFAAPTRQKSPSRSGFEAVSFRYAVDGCLDRTVFAPEKFSANSRNVHGSISDGARHRVNAKRAPHGARFKDQIRLVAD